MKGSTESPTSHLSRRNFLGSALAGTAATLAGAALYELFRQRSSLRPEQPHTRPGPEGTTRRQRAIHCRTLHELRRGQADPAGPYRREAAAVRCPPLLCRLPRAHRDHFRPEHWRDLRHPGRRQHGHARDHRQPRIRSCCPRNQGHYGSWSLWLRSRQSRHRGKEVPGEISALFPLLRPAVDQAGSDLAATTNRMPPSRRAC